MLGEHHNRLVKSLFSRISHVVLLLSVVSIYSASSIVRGGGGGGGMLASFPGHVGGQKPTQPWNEARGMLEGVGGY